MSSGQNLYKICMEAHTLLVHLASRAVPSGLGMLGQRDLRLSNPIEKEAKQVSHYEYGYRVGNLCPNVVHKIKMQITSYNATASPTVI